jgi:hypothetical protein
MNKNTYDGDASDDEDLDLIEDFRIIKPVHFGMRKDLEKKKKKKGTMRWGVAWSFTTHGLSTISSKDKVRHRGSSLTTNNGFVSFKVRYGF